MITDLTKPNKDEQNCNLSFEIPMPENVEQLFMENRL